MQIDNPFTNGQIKNYLLFYASILLIIILFFIASSLFHDVKNVEENIFKTQSEHSIKKTVQDKTAIKKPPIYKFKLLDKAY